MKNILMLLANPFRPDPRVYKEAESLSSAGFQVTVLCWDRAGEYPQAETLPCGTQIMRVQNVRSGYGIGASQLRKLPYFWREIQQRLPGLRPDLIHCHDFDTLPIGLWWGKPRRIPVVYDAHEYYAELVRPRLHGMAGSILYRGIKISEQIGARFADAVITVDPTLGKIYQRFNHRVLILGHYPPRRLAEEPGQAFQGDQLRLLYAGRISTDRGMLIYAELLRELLRRGIPARLILAGAFIPEAERERFVQACQGIDEAITYLGWVPFTEMENVNRNADVGLAILMPLPRFTAALPVKLFEYMAAGLPVIASDFPLIREIVNLHGCGTLIDPMNGVSAAAEAITTWWMNRNAGIRAGERGRQAVLDVYNWEKLMSKLISLYQSLLQSG